jgi:hypothetical protein
MILFLEILNSKPKNSKSKKKGVKKEIPYSTKYKMSTHERIQNDEPMNGAFQKEGDEE